MRTSSPLGDELQECLAGEPSQLAFRAVCSILDTWPGDVGEALAFASRQLESWPDEHRVAPWSWCNAVAAGERKPTWELVRALSVYSGHIGCESCDLRQIGPECAGPRLTTLQLNRFAYLDDNDGASFLTGDPERWTGLRRVRGLDCKDDSLRAFLASDLLARLQDIEVFLPSSPRSANPVPGLTRSAEHLEHLRIEFSHSKDVRPLLADEFLPRLKDLSLKEDWFTEAAPEHLRVCLEIPPSENHVLNKRTLWFPSTVRPESVLKKLTLRRLADLPLFARLERLSLAQFPQEVVLALLGRRDLRLARLELPNRDYNPPNLVAYQQRACRLNAKGVRALSRAPTLATLTHLSVQNERVGDDILRLVKAATPGTLETLELVNVGLTDSGMARLARMRQLSGVTSINLQANEFTAAGLAALLRSRHLGGLQRLYLGGGVPYSPYYSFTTTHALGDPGAEALAASGLLSDLRELVLSSAAIGHRGSAALAGVNAPHLSRLDLSGNPLGVEGMKSLAACGLLSRLRELGLSVCELDDIASAHLAGNHFESLRNLEVAYNSISPAGARHLADAPGLQTLWRLNLHDNFIGDEGLIALAGSPHLGRLVELDLQQDVWNYRRSAFEDEAARAVAASRTFARIDALFAGEVDEYHGGPAGHAFSRTGRETLRASTRLRPETRLMLSQAGEEETEEGQAAEEDHDDHYLHYTPRQIERSRREHDFRGLPPPELSMDERQWLESVDPAWMLEFLGDRATPRKLRLFACACARRVFSLDPDPKLGRLIELGERWADNQATVEECKVALHSAQEGRPYDPAEQVQMSVGGACYATVNETVRQAVDYATSQAVQAFVTDARRRQKGSVRSVSYTPEHAAQAGLVRCIFGNPHHPVEVHPAWRTWNGGTIPSIARAIYDEKDFARLPVLADALEEAGCTDAEALGHCRSGDEHTRGCWVVDLLLGQP